MNVVLLNGQWIPESEATVSAFDRGFLYGDGLFETVRCYRGRPFRWREHYQRWSEAAGALGIRVPGTCEALCETVVELLRRNHRAEAIVRLTLTRGVGARGYSPKGADTPTLVAATFPAPDLPADRPLTWRLGLSSVVLAADDPLARLKTCNKLPQILARAEAEAQGVDEVLLRNSSGQIAEGAASNVFWVEQGRLLTPPLSAGILPGITRQTVMDLARSSGVDVVELSADLATLRRADGVFMTLSTLELVEAIELEGQSLARTRLTQELWQRYRAEVMRTCG